MSLTRCVHPLRLACSGHTVALSHCTHRVHQQEGIREEVKIRPRGRVIVHTCLATWALAAGQPECNQRMSFSDILLLLGSLCKLVEG
jgi:hypothetical protein